MLYGSQLQGADMENKFSTMLGMANTLNSLETDEDIKIFLTKYKKWYINDKKYSKIEAEQQIEKDIKYFAHKFIKKPDLLQKLSHLMGYSF